VKVTIHARAREDVPALVRTLLLIAAARTGVEVTSVGRPGVTVDAETALAYLANARPAAGPVADGPPRLATSPAATNVAAIAARAESTVGLRERRKPRKNTTASSEG
jgi:hypothetical protein